MSGSIVARLKLARDDFTLDVDLNLPGRGISALCFSIRATYSSL